MATSTHRGILYTISGSSTVTVDLDLPLQGGVDQDDGTWISAYPGALTDFAARQSDGTNRMQPRLVCLTLGAVEKSGTLVLSTPPDVAGAGGQSTGGGGANVILAGMCHGNDPTANLAMTISALTCTFDCELSSDGTTDDTSNGLVWLIVA